MKLAKLNLKFWQILIEPIQNRPSFLKFVLKLQNFAKSDHTAGDCISNLPELTASIAAEMVLLPALRNFLCLINFHRSVRTSVGR